jgi:hypothetical protein
MAEVEEVVEALRRRLPNGGTRFDLADAIEAFEASYCEGRLNGDEDDTLIVVVGKFGKRSEARFEIAIYRSFGLFRQLGVSLKYPVQFRHHFLKTSSDFCESFADAELFFSQLRSHSWFRRYAHTPATDCSIRWRGEDEMIEMFANILPKMAEALGTCCSGVCTT